MKTRGMFRLFAALACTWLANAQAAVPLGYTWADATFNVSTGDLSVTQPKSGAWLSAFATAADRWTDRTIVAVTTDNNIQTADCASSGPNSTFFANTFCGSPWGSTTLATARTFFFTTGPQAGEADHTDIVFKSSVNWSVTDQPTSGSQTDFTRVAVHELGHSIGLDHTPDTTAIMYFLSGDTIAPQTDDVFGTNRFNGAEVDHVIVVDDLSGNGWDEIGVALIKDNGDFILSVRDGKNDTKLKQLNLGKRPLVSMASAPDTNGNGAAEVVVLTKLKSGHGKLRVFDLETKALVSQKQLAKNINWVDVITIADTDGGGQPDMVAVGLNASDQARGQIYDIPTATKIRNLNFGSADEVIQLLELPDTTGNLVPEVLALVTNASGQGVARIREGASGATVTNVAFGSTYAPLAIALGRDTDGNGARELLQLGQSAGGGLRVARRDLGTGGPSTNTFFDSSNQPVGVVGLNDSNSDGVPDYGVIMERDGEDPRLRLINGVTGTTFKTVFFTNIGDSQDVIAIPDQNNSGRAEVVVIGNDDGTYKTQTRDSKSGNSLNTITYP